MAANLNEPFDESCCDGGEGNAHTSAQPCGCDPGANWVCAMHRKNGYHKRTPLAAHLDDVVNVTWNFSNLLTTEKDHFLNAAVGLAAEAGEVLDVHKKLFFHTPKNRREELVSELGDVYYYLLKLQELHNITTEECLENNKIKLMGRYPDHFSGRS